MKTMEKIKPKTIFKDVYVVQNYGAFRELFWRYKDAVEYARDEENYYKDKLELFQIYKCTVQIHDPVQKNFRKSKYFLN